MNATLKPLTSIAEIDTMFFLRSIHKELLVNESCYPYSIEGLHYLHLSGIGGIDSKYNLHDCFLLYQIRESFLLSNEVP